MGNNTFLSKNLSSFYIEVICSLIILIFFSCENNKKHSSFNGSTNKSIFNKDLEGNWLSVDYVNTLNKTNCIHATMELPKFWTELNFSENGQLESHTVGSGLSVSYKVDTNNYTFFGKKLVWDSLESLESHYDTICYRLSKIENDTLYILENESKTIKYFRFRLENTAYSYFPSSWKNYTNRWISGSYTFEFLDEKNELNLKTYKTELKGYKEFSNWEFYTDFGYDIISFKSSPYSEDNEETFKIDRIDFVVDSLVDDRFYLTQIISPTSGWLDMIEKTNDHAILYRK